MKEFYELITYMEQLICSYKSTKSLSSSISECTLVFPENSQMGKLLRSVLRMLQTGEGITEGQIERQALGLINKSYPSKRLRLLHEFILQAQESGIDVTESLNIIFEDIQLRKQHSISYQKDTTLLSKKKLGKRNHILQEFAFWLLAVAMYLPNNNVYQAVIHSKTYTEGAFREEVENFIEHIYENPSAFTPFLKFFSELKSTEIQFAMRLLYSISESQGEDRIKQICFLVEQKNQIMDNFEKNYALKKRRKMNKKHIVNCWGMCIFLAALIITCTDVMAKNIHYSDAVRFHETVVKTLEENNFTDDCIEKCKKESQLQGYNLEVEVFGEQENKDARVLLEVVYRFPIWSKEKEKRIEGYAR